MMAFAPSPNVLEAPLMAIGNRRLLSIGSSLRAVNCKSTSAWTVQSQFQRGDAISAAPAGAESGRYIRSWDITRWTQP